MKKDKVYFMCPYLDGSPEGALCHVVKELIKNIKDANLNLCMGRHFERCHLYAAILKEMAEISLFHNSIKTENRV
jgi:hypothetical protein